MLKEISWTTVYIIVHGFWPDGNKTDGIMTCIIANALQHSIESVPTVIVVATHPCSGVDGGGCQESAGGGEHTAADLPRVTREGSKETTAQLPLLQARNDRGGGYTCSVT